MKPRLLLLALLPLAGCRDPQAVDLDRPLVRILQIGGEEDGELRRTVSERELRTTYARLRFEREGETLRAAALPVELKKHALDDLVDRKILAAEAERLGVRASTTAVEREISRAKEALSDRIFQRRLGETYQTEEDYRRVVDERLTVGRLLAEVAHAKIAVEPAELEKAWETLAEEKKKRPPRVRALHIVVRTEEEGAQIVSALKNGASFEALAKKHSISPEASKGGDLGWFEQGMMPKVFDDVCFSLKPGQTSPLVSSEYGFHLFRVIANEDGKPLAFEDAKERLESMVLKHKLEEAELAFMERVKSRYKIVRDDRRIAAVE
ncbi:MAG: peptidylprolyl isomerase [Myxococcota bacterium]